MITALVNGAIFTTDPIPGKPWLGQHAVIIEHEKIIALCDENHLPQNVDEIIDLKGERLIPGLIDTQMNGGGGVLFNDSPSVETLQIISSAHRRYGTTGFYPTLISDDLSVMKQAIAAVTQAIANKIPGVLGIHLEGPFLNPERKGVHDATKFKTLDEPAFQLLTSLNLGKTLVTLAPELTTPEMISRLVKAGVIVAAGHSSANYAQTKIALAAGLSSFTHLFNAMTPLTSREPGMVGAALESEQAWCGIIADGIHVHPTTLKVAHTAKTKGKMVLVTDAMPSVGAIEKTFLLNGELIHHDNGRLTTSTGTLAGSDLNILAAVKNAVSMMGVSIEEAICMASIYPATMMGIADQFGKINAGYNASMILIDADFQLVRSWINGKEN